jgi:hypothetical protein
VPTSTRRSRYIAATDQVDETYFNRLPTGRSEITAEEAHELAVIFGKGGELAAEPLS